MTPEQAIQFIAQALGEYADTMRPLNKQLFVKEAQLAISAMQKPEEKKAVS
jgi:hypothetical protein